MVTRQGGGDEGAGLEVLVITCSVDGAALRGIGLGGDIIAVEGEVGHVTGRTGDLELVGFGSTHHRAVEGPADKVVTRGGRGGQSAGLEVLEITRAADGAAFRGIGGGGDAVAVQREVGHVMGRAGDLELVGFGSAHHGAVEGPVEEVVTRQRCGHQGAGLEVIVLTRSVDGAALRGIGLRGDIIAVEGEVGHITGRTGDLELVGFGSTHHRAVEGPADEVVTRGGRGGQSAGLEVLEITRAADGAAFRGIGGGGDAVAVQREVGHIMGRASDLELVGFGSTHHRAVEGPFEEVVTRQRRGHQRAGVEVMVGVGSGNCAAHGGIGLGGDGVAVDLEVGHIVGGTCHLELVLSLGGDHVAVEGPVEEVVAGVGVGGEGAGVEVLVAARALDGAALGGFGGDGDVVAVQGEVRHVLGGTGDLELVFGLGGDHAAVEGPADEVVAFGGSGGEGAEVKVVVGALALDGAAFYRLGDDGNPVVVDLEVGHIVGGTGDLELVFGLVGDDGAVEGPIEEVVAGVGSGGEGAEVEVVVGAVALDGASLGGLGGGGDAVAVEPEVGDVVSVVGDLELVFGFSGDHVAVEGPVEEVVSRVGGGVEGAGGAMLEGATARGGSSHLGIRGDGDVVGVDGEVCGDEGGVGDGDEAGGVGGGRLSVDDPVGEVISRVGVRREGGGGAVVIDAGAGDGASDLGLGVGDDGESLEPEDGGEGGVAGDGEGIDGVVGDVGSVEPPVEESVALVGGGGEGAEVEVVVGSSSREGSGHGVADGDDLVFLGGEVGDEVGGGGGLILEGGLRGDEGVVGVGPAEETVPLVGFGVEGDGGSVVVATRAGEGAAALGVGGGGDHIVVELEVGDVIRGSGDLELVCGLFRDHGVVEGPADEMVADDRRGYEGTSVEVVVVAVSRGLPAHQRLGG